VEEIVQDENFDAGQYLILSLGLGLALNYFAHLLVALSKQLGWIRGEEGIGRIAVTSHDRGTARVKQAATRKLNQMLKNANLLHAPIHASADRATLAIPSSLKNVHDDPTFQNFVLYGENKVPAGSFRWTWQRIISGRLFDTEGIWLPTRLLVFQAGQALFGLFIGYGAFATVGYVATIAQDAQDSLPEDDLIPQWVYDIVPTGKQVKQALYPACAVSTIVMLMITLTYIPR
jgi:hypothetical protein